MLSILYTMLENNVYDSPALTLSNTSNYSQPVMVPFADAIKHILG